MTRTHEDIQDELLVLQCQEGDGDALKALIARWQPRLARLAWRLTGESEAARDVVQDAWLAIVRGLKRLDDPARFRWWAYRIVTNKCADWIRRRSVRRIAAQELRDVAASTPASCCTSDVDSAMLGVLLSTEILSFVSRNGRIQAMTLPKTIRPLQVHLMLPLHLGPRENAGQLGHF